MCDDDIDLSTQNTLSLVLSALLTWPGYLLREIAEHDSSRISSYKEKRHNPEVQLNSTDFIHLQLKDTQTLKPDKPLTGC